MIILKSWAVYNEIEEYAADWIENLITLGVIAPGIVDRRSIVDIRPDDYRGFRQAHFFAGVAVWSYALRRSSISDDTALWTGSCPCQPFSAAGAGGGVDDERHLWPHWFHLIRECRPDRVYGEQVASKDGLGWLDLVWSDMEDEDYAIGPFDTCSAGSGAPHIRQRLRFRADNLRSSTGGLADDSSAGLGIRSVAASWGRGEVNGSERLGAVDRLDDCLGAGLEGQRDGHCPATGQRQGSLRPVATAGGIEWVASGDDDDGRSDLSLGGPQGRTVDGGSGATLRMVGRTAPARPGPTNGFWRDADWLFCRDGKWRPVESGTFPLVDGSTFRLGSGSAFEGKSRQGMLKGYGNAIDAEATIDFIEATLDTIEHEPAGSLISQSTESGLDDFEDML